MVVYKVEVVHRSDTEVWVEAEIDLKDLVPAGVPVYYDRKGVWIEDDSNLTRDQKARAATRPRPSRCEACGNPCKTGKELNFDHCHETGRFRGWLCMGCNVALGFCEDSPWRLRALATYQEKFSGAKPEKIVKRSPNSKIAKRMQREEEEYLKGKALFKAALEAEPDKPRPLPTFK